MKNYQKMPIIGYCYLKTEDKNHKLPIVEIIQNKKGTFYVTNEKYQNTLIILPKKIVENYVTIENYEKYLIDQVIKEELGRITGLPIFRLGHPMTLKYEDTLYSNLDENPEENKESQENITEEKFPDITNLKLTELYKKYKHLKK